MACFEKSREKGLAEMFLLLHVLAEGPFPPARGLGSETTPSRKGSENVKISEKTFISCFTEIGSNSCVTGTHASNHVAARRVTVAHDHQPIECNRTSFCVHFDNDPRQRLGNTPEVTDCTRARYATCTSTCTVTGKMYIDPPVGKATRRYKINTPCKN
jgi:hypothetical protein